MVFGAATLFELARRTYSRFFSMYSPSLRFSPSPRHRAANPVRSPAEGGIWVAAWGTDHSKWGGFLAFGGATLFEPARRTYLRFSSMYSPSLRFSLSPRHRAAHPILSLVFASQPVDRRKPKGFYILPIKARIIPESAFLGGHSHRHAVFYFFLCQNQTLFQNVFV